MRMEFYHVINRGVEKRNVFLEDGDRIRFIHDMYIFNDKNNAPNYVVKERRERRHRTLLVYIHAYCLMRNHYHLLLSSVQENGISKFMQKLNMGYAKYFNEKYDRSGVLWQGTFRKMPIQRDAHFLFIPYYIHLNPLDFAFPEWRTGTVKKVDTALMYLKKYRWSSHLDYAGSQNFPSVIHKAELDGSLGSPKRYEKELRDIITNPAKTRSSDTIEI